MLNEFTLPNLLILDGGKIAIAWKRNLEAIIRDCQDRPGNTKSRKLLLQLELTPVVDEVGELGSLDADFQLKNVLPNQVSNTYNLGVRRINNKPCLVFNDLSEGDVHQRTIDQDADLDGDE